MGLHRDFLELNSSIAELTKTQRLRLYEYERKQQLRYYLYVKIYNCYIQGVNVYSAHERAVIILETQRTAKVTLHNSTYTTAFLNDIYAATCKAVVTEHKQAQQAQAPPESTAKPPQLREYYTALAIIGFLIYITILSLGG